MHTLEHAMPPSIDRRHPRFRRRAPHQEHDPPRPLLRHDVDDLLRELFPPLLRVAVGLLVAHGQDGVEHQHALFRPRHEQAAVLGRGLEVGVVLFERDVDVLQRGWGGSLADGETESVGLVDVVVGVLAEDHGFHRVERGMFGPGPL